MRLDLVPEQVFRRRFWKSSSYWYGEQQTVLQLVHTLFWRIQCSCLVPENDCHFYSGSRVMLIVRPWEPRAAYLLAKP